MARQRSRRRIELGWFEAGVLAIGYVGSLAVVGVAGFIIGQRSVGEQLSTQERLLRLPVSASGGSGDRRLGSVEPEMTFYTELLEKDGPVREGRIIVPEKEPEKRSPQRWAEEQAGAESVKQPKRQPTSVPETTQVRAPEPPGTRSISRTAPGSQRASRTEEERRPEVKPPPAVIEARSRTAEPQAALRREATRRVTSEAQATARAIGDAAPDAGAVTPGLGSPLEKAQPVASRSPIPPPGVSPEAAATARELARAELPAAPAGASKGTWSVQVNATQDGTLAADLARRLRERGYDAFVVEQSREGAIWYRVRVGRLNSIEMANALVSKLKETENLPHAFVASD